MSVILILAGQAARAATLTVGDGGSYTRIQDAIDDSSDGDLIEIAAGTYSESLKIDELSLTLSSASGVTLLSPPSGEDGITIEGGVVEIIGLTIQPASGQGLVLTDATVDFSDGAIEGASGSQGGGIFLSGGSLSLVDVTLADNTATYGADLYAEDDAEVSLTRTDAEGGSASWGGSLYVDTGTLSLSEVTFSDSIASYGGGIVAIEATISAVSVDATDISSTYTAGFAWIESGSLTAESLTISDVSGSRTYGGGIYADDATLTWTGGGISGVRISEAASGYSGGGIYLSGDSVLTGSSLTFSDNRTGNGGAVAAIESIAVLTDCIFEGNEAYNAGGALYLTTSASVSCAGCSFEDNVADQGGAVEIIASAAFTDEGGIYTDNEADDDDGGAIRLADGGALSLSAASFSGNVAARSGGALYLEDPDDTVLIESCAFESNQTGTGDGGGIFATDGAELWLSLTDIFDNEAGGDGGGIFASDGAELTIEDGEISDNTADDGGGIFADGADLLEIVGVTLTGNEAGGDGGGILAEDCEEVTLSRLLMHDNEAADGGGAVLERDTPTNGATEITNCVFTENTATDGAALLLIDNAIQTSVLNNTFAANDAASDGAHLYLSSATVSFINNIAWLGADGGGLYALDTDSAQDSDFYYSDVSNNSGGDYIGELSDPTGESGNISEDPDLRDFSADGVEDNDDLHLSLSSPCLDAGDPTLVDVDGTVSDMGAYGGPDADAADDDGDGYYDITDCDDSDSSVHPGASETPYDGIDQDCDGADLTDVDGDGFDADVVGGDDCDDDDADVNPDASEIWYDGIDANCDGLSDFDADGDGYDSDLYGGDDCDDDDASVSPGAPERWYDGFDQNCDGASDYDADSDGHGASAYGGDDCDDTDGDTFPGASETPYDGIDQDCDGADLTDVDGDGYPGGDPGTDCDDTDPTIHPGAQDELYDGVDSDCSGDSDFDADGDGYDAEAFGGDDCDDTDPYIHPGMPELYYDGIDRDCDGGSDFDADGDGHDADAYGGDDCDDTDPDISPGAPEQYYDGIDANCDGISDFDADRDGYESDEFGGLDCDDTSSAINPGAEEIFDGLDNDCDGRTEQDDRDSDGLIDWFEWMLGSDDSDPDTDDDGWLDGEEAPEVEAGVDARDTDTDGIFDLLDSDDDGDGIPTSREQSTDIDGDGEPDTDVDGDGLPNGLDTDSDGDTWTDASEGESDADGDGIPEYLDYNGDFTGGGCSTAPMVTGWLLPMFLIGWRRR